MGKYVFNPLSGKFDYTETGGGVQSIVAGSNITVDATDPANPEVSADVPYYQYIYNSSGSQSGNRFNDWADLITAIDGRKAIIQFEQSETLPTGAWNHPNITWVGLGQNPDSGGLLVTVETGTTLVNAINFDTQNGVSLLSTSANPVIVLPNGATILIQRSDWTSTTAPLISQTGNGLTALGIADGFGVRNGGAPIISVTSGADPYGAFIIFSMRGVSPIAENDTIESANAIAYGIMIQSSEAANTVPTFSGLAAGSTNIAPSPNNLFSNAKVIGFSTGQPAGIASGNVSDALAELASGKASLVSAPSSASDTGVAGQFAYDTSYIYICTATDTWKRIGVSTW